jgi:serine/threonine protein kinase
VFRCYDNRLRYTDRRPDVYLESYIFPRAKEFFRIKDSERPILNFGKQDFCDDYDHSNDPDWLWKFRGQLMVISTQYLHGKHYAESPLQLLALVLHLEQLHSIGYFHGDIRGYNIVFQKEANVGNKDRDNVLEGHRGYLIDFDFAGNKGAESTKYPRAYQRSLPDGSRLGKAGDKITLHHEWFSLKHILFDLHIMVSPDDPTTALINKRQSLLLKFAADGAPTEAEIQDLKEFLVEIHQHGWKIVPSASFKIQLQEHGLYEQPSSPAVARTGTNHATGSPEKANCESRALPSEMLTAM